jgi:hypothetical protein
MRRRRSTTPRRVSHALTIGAVAVGGIVEVGNSPASKGGELRREVVRLRCSSVLCGGRGRFFGHLRLRRSRAPLIVGTCKRQLVSPRSAAAPFAYPAKIPKARSPGASICVGPRMPRRRTLTNHLSRRRQQGVRGAGGTSFRTRAALRAAAAFAPSRRLTIHPRGNSSPGPATRRPGCCYFVASRRDVGHSEVRRRI